MSTEEDDLRSLGVEIATKAGKVLRDNLAIAGSDGAWSIKDMIASYAAWAKTVDSLLDSKGEAPQANVDSLPTLENVREAIRAAKAEHAP